jgi:hypothetical protein
MGVSYLVFPQTKKIELVFLGNRAAVIFDSFGLEKEKKMIHFMIRFLILVTISGFFPVLSQEMTDGNRKGAKRT